VFVRRLALALALVLLPAWLAWGRDPDVVLISLDTFRADRLAPWGGAKEVAPRLNALAARGTVFTGCWTPSPITLPAHATLLTGYGPAGTGLHDNGAGRLPKDVPTLAEALAQRGYRTHAVVASRILASRFGLDRGFAVYDDQVGPTLVRAATQVTDRGLAALKAPRQQPLFLFLHYYDTHEPYPAPDAFRHRFSSSAYDAAAAYVDSEVGRLLGGLREGTLVAVVSDHGEALGEHGELTHGVLLHLPTLRAVFFLAGPGVEAGKAMRDSCSLADVSATLLGRLAPGKPAPGSDGRDLLAPAGPSRSPKPLLLEAWLPFNQFRWCPLLGVTDGQYLWVRGRRDSLFDVKTDPRESRDLSAAPPEAALRLMQLLPALPASSPQTGPVDEAIRGLGYAPVPGGSLKGSDLPDPRDRTDILKLMATARLDRSLDNLDRAARLYGQAASQDPRNPSALFEWGETLRRSGKLKEALAALDRAIAAAPAMAEAWTAKGHALVTLEKPEEAARCYETALALAPDAIEALNPLAAWFLDQNQPDKAFPLLDRAEAGGFANADTFLMQGRIHLIQNRREEAIADFETALQLSQDPRRTLKAEGDIFMLRGWVAEGIRGYEEGIRRHPDFAPNYLTLGSFFLTVEEPAKALPLFKKALACDLDPDTRKNVADIVADLEKLKPGRD
jgi:arylsulfatase A-like enzyme/Tfp pilus assembly protein PilF